mmetsp:Transcript_31092/g.88768  ORF Transcript_31092/g.88768 Transcript_31092/m.88768 type:complete len:362 (+) Transcript_31092:315-1400(+)
MADNVSGDMLFIISSVAFIISGLFRMAEGSMSGIEPSPEPLAPPRILELISIIFCNWSGGMFFIISDIWLINSGFAAICSAALRIMSASSGLLMFILFKSSGLRFFVIAAACRIMSGFSKRAAGLGFAPAVPPPCDCKLCIAVFSNSGFFCRCSIWLFMVSASMPGGNGVLPIMRWRSSGDILDMASVACFNMSGLPAICSAALAHWSEPGPVVLPLLPPPAAFQASETTCALALLAAPFGSGIDASSMPLLFNSPCNLVNSRPMALSLGDRDWACRTSANASLKPPLASRAWPRRKYALKLLESILRASSHASTALSKFSVFKWHKATLLRRFTFNVSTSPPTWSRKFSSALPYFANAAG